MSDYFYDGIASGEGYMLARQIVRSNTPAITSSSGIIVLDTQGVLSSSATFEPNPRHVVGCLLQRPETISIDFIATTCLPYDRWDLVRYTVDAQGTPYDTTRIHGGEYRHFYFENAARTSDGGLAVALGTWISEISGPFTRLMTARFDAQGDSANTLSYDSPLAPFTHTTSSSARRIPSS